MRAWRHTYGLPVVLTNCSNNYGPYHFPEKLIPLTIVNALEGKPLPVYGRGRKRARLVVRRGPRRSVARSRCARRSRRKLQHWGALRAPQHRRGRGDLRPRRRTGAGKAIRLAPRLIAFVADRPGHDLRYAIDPSKIEKRLGWRPRHSFEVGLRKTVRWYLDNRNGGRTSGPAPIAANGLAWRCERRKMNVEDTEIEGVKLITPRRFEDDRGFFSEVYNSRAFAEAGLELGFVQDNHSFSAEAGTIRGLHFQIAAIRAGQTRAGTSGAQSSTSLSICRRSSKTFGRHVKVELSSSNWRQIFVPEGFRPWLLSLWSPTRRSSTR